MDIPLIEQKIPENIKHLRQKIATITEKEVYLGEDVFEHGKYVAYLCEPLPENWLSVTKPSQP